MIITQVNCTLLAANKPPQGAAGNPKVEGEAGGMDYVCVADEAQG